MFPCGVGGSHLLGDAQGRERQRPQGSREGGRPAAAPAPEAGEVPLAAKPGRPTALGEGDRAQELSGR